MSDKTVAAGINSVEETVGLTGLVPLEVIELPPVTLRHDPGKVEIWIDLPAGVRFADAPIELRVYGGEAGLDFERNGQIVEIADLKMPITLPYQPRVYPEPPPRGQMVLELSFRFLWNDNVMIQDLQWRQLVIWDKGGTKKIELRYTLVP